MYAGVAKQAALLFAYFAAVRAACVTRAFRPHLRRTQPHAVFVPSLQTVRPGQAQGEPLTACVLCCEARTPAAACEFQFCHVFGGQRSIFVWAHAPKPPHHAHETTNVYKRASGCNEAGALAGLTQRLLAGWRAAHVVPPAHARTHRAAQEVMSSERRCDGGACRSAGGRTWRCWHPGQRPHHSPSTWTTRRTCKHQTARRTHSLQSRQPTRRSRCQTAAQAGPQVPDRVT